MRALFWLWVGFLLVCLVTDTVSYWVVRSRLGESLELALDAALVGGIEEGDLIWGKQLTREDRAGVWAREIFQKNMKGSLEGKLSFSFELKQEADQIWTEGRAKAELPYLLGALVGKGSREIVINKKMAYQGLYK
ncbi:MAG: hypothetical protein FWG28_01235 [Clostridiales bacterium]|nr:hypothetical protein [Clostridiales bacterium]